MIQIDKAYAAVADDRLVGVQKPIVMGDVDDPSIRVSRRIEKLLDPAVVCRGDNPSFVRRPGLPRLPGWIAALEGESAVFGQVIVGSSQDGDGIVIGQQRLEGMAPSCR